MGVSCLLQGFQLGEHLSQASSFSASIRKKAVQEGPVLLMTSSVQVGGNFLVLKLGTTNDLCSPSKEGPS